MKNENLKKQLLEIANDCEELNVVITDTINYTDAETAQDFIDELEERISEQEIIYYSRAIVYLQENDTSLCESLRLANELGYTTEQLNSELLATLLYQENLRYELNKIKGDIEDAFKNNADE